jgi:hypothetical protein
MVTQYLWKSLTHKQVTFEHNVNVVSQAPSILLRSIQATGALPHPLST